MMKLEMGNENLAVPHTVANDRRVSDLSPLLSLFSLCQITLVLTLFFLSLLLVPPLSFLLSFLLSQLSFLLLLPPPPPGLQTFDPRSGGD